jgi:hypothetical protein
MKHSGKLASKVIAMMMIAVFFSLGLVSFALAKRDMGNYPSNISVGGISLAGLSREEAFDLLNSNLPDYYTSDLLFQIKEETFRIPMKDWGIGYDIEATISKVENLIYKDQGISEFFKPILIRGQKLDINPVFYFETDLVKEKMLEFKKNRDQLPIDARILLENDLLEYKAHKYGYSINMDKSLDRLIDNLQQGLSGPVNISVREICPRVKLEDIKEVKDVLGVSAIGIGLLSHEERSFLECANGLIIMPAETFSINSIFLGAGMSESNMAKTVDDMLNKCCSQAGLEVEERPVRFMNDLGNPILLAVEIDDSNLFMKIIGCQTHNNRDISIITEREDILPEVQMLEKPGIMPGQRIVQEEGESGYIDRTYRFVKENGKEIEKTLLSENIVPGLDTIILVGPGDIK